MVVLAEFCSVLKLLTGLHFKELVGLLIRICPRYRGGGDGSTVSTFPLITLASHTAQPATSPRLTLQPYYTRVSSAV